MKQNLRRILLCAVLASLPFMGMQAYDWVPVGDSVDANGFALTGVNYVAGDYVAFNAPNLATYNGPFTAAISPGDSTLNVYGTLYTNAPSQGGTQVAGPLACSLKINGNVVVDAATTNMTININEDTVIEPYFDPPVGSQYSEAECAQLYFKTAAATTITINVDHNLEFAGKTVDGVGYRDLLISFAGRGTVIFNMADGTSVKFNGQIDASSPLVLIDPETGAYSPYPAPSNAAAGTKVFICMDQTAEDYTHNKNKVLFQRKTLGEATSTQSVLVEVGPNSLITYLSDNLTGEAGEGYVGGYGSMAFDPSNGHEAVVGTGRMVLVIRGAYYVDPDQYIESENEELIPNPTYNMIIEKYLFNDASVMVAGHYVPGFEPEDISGVALGETEGALPGYDFSTPAGILATMRVVDNKHYMDLSAPSQYDPAVTARRGLLVVNDVVNHGKLMADPYWDLYAPEGEGYLGLEWAASNPANALINIRKGFILGVNGQVDVYHNCFMDHACGSVNMVDPLALYDYGLEEFGGDPSLLKHRNSAAIIIDGLDPSLFSYGNPLILDDLGQPTKSDFIAADPFQRVTPICGQMLLRGNGTVYSKACADSRPGFGYIFNLFSTGIDPINDPDTNWTTILGMGTATYDGYQITAGETTVESGEGVHVLDVEGQGNVESVAMNTVYNLVADDLRVYADALVSAYGTDVTTHGVFNAAALLIDYTGREVYTDDGEIFTRPLLADGTEYTRYNSTGLFLNNFIRFTNSILRHSDPCKYVDGIPALSEPSMTGGERLWYSVNYWTDSEDNKAQDPDRFRLPEMRFFNGMLQMYESLNISGFRQTVKDVYLGTEIQTPLAQSNTSYFQFFDHGDPLDTTLTGFGRIFQYGSALNLMYDGSNNYVTESAMLNVFKHSAPVAENPLTASSTVKLSLLNGDQFDPDTQAKIDTFSNMQDKLHFISTQRAHHLIMFSVPPTLEFVQPGNREPVCNMAIGWSNNTLLPVSPLSAAGTNAPAGNAAAFPHCYPYAEEPVSTGGEYVSSPFVIDALLTPAATVSIDGSIICFGSFDSAGHSIPVPLSTDNNSGAVYVKHGGKITITTPVTPDLPLGAHPERFYIPYQAVFSTMIGQRMWNDYNYDGNTRLCWLTGIVDLPHDQVTFDNKTFGFGVQPYNINAEMFRARRFSLDNPLGVPVYGSQGYVRMSFENETRNPRRDRSGAEEVTLGTFYMDYDVTASFPGTAGDYLPKSVDIRTLKGPSAALTRATESINTPCQRPTDLLYIGPGDDIVQMRVTGATMSDVFALDISGDGLRPVPARVREFTSLKSTRDQLADHFISDGAHAVLFCEYGGRVGLGSRKWNDHSVNAWNLLGKDYVSLCPLGDGVIDLNDHVLVTDRLAFIASDMFGNSPDQTTHRLTFNAEMPYEIRVPAGGELDLSAFGRITQTGNKQEIAFTGKVKLIIEEGATLRLPDLPTENNSFTLFFGDEAQLVFEGAKEAAIFVPYTDAKNNIYGRDGGELNSAPASNSRIRILGKGNITFDKYAQMIVNGNTFVGVETDSLTQNTDLTINLLGQSLFTIGTETVAGGAFQVGNADSTYSETSEINFKLYLNGPQATFHLDRQGFFGLGAGVINKYGNPNGKSSTSGNPVLVDGLADSATIIVEGETIVAPKFSPDIDPWNGEWQVQRLYCARDITIEIQRGIIDHYNIFDGSDLQASLMAIGPVTHQYTWKQSDPATATVRGGGNVLYVPSNITIGGIEHDVSTALHPIFVNIWDYATGPVYAGTETDYNGERYSILASGPLLLDRATAETPGYQRTGRTFSFTGTTRNLEFFNLLAFNPRIDQTSPKVDFATTQFVTYVGYTNGLPDLATLDENDPRRNTVYLNIVSGDTAPGAQIFRIASPMIASGNEAIALDKGSLSVNASGNYFVQP